MQKDQHIPYQAFENFILRTPLLPLESIESFYSENRTFHEELRKFYELPEVQEAMFLASPALYDQMMKWLHTENIPDDKLLITLIKYISRMSTRCTPFGLFAGISIGTYEHETLIELEGRSRYKKHTRLDMYYLCAFAADLVQEKKIQEKIKFHPNSSIYKIRNKIRYVEYSYQKGRRIHSLVSVENSEYLTKILQAAKKGLTRDEISHVLYTEGIDKNEAKDYIIELIDNQLLLSELESKITGIGLLDQIHSTLVSYDTSNPKLAKLKMIRSLLKKMDVQKIGLPVNRYKQMESIIKELDTDFEQKYLYQVDMFKPVKKCFLKHDIIYQVLKGVSLLSRLNPSSDSGHMLRFKSMFKERYGNKEMPLCQALDVECGIGYGADRYQGDFAPLIDDIIFPKSQSKKKLSPNPINDYLHNKYLESSRKKLDEIRITDEEVKGFHHDWENLPDTFNAIIRLTGDKKNNKGFLYLESAGSTSAANLLGRFCNTDKSVFNHVRSITEMEAYLNPDSILAEIVHLPESRVGNILHRPVLRAYEIPYIAQSSVTHDFQIPIDDLFISIKEDKIHLRSKRFQKQVIPRMSAAHNYAFNALPVYHFLCDLQHQGKKSGLSFQWDDLSEKSEFLPRVIYDNLIISQAIWNINTDNLPFKLSEKNSGALSNSINQWRKIKKIPSKIIIRDGDQELYIDLDHEFGKKILVSILKKKKNHNLSEFLNSHDDCVVHSEEGRFANEVIISFFKSTRCC